MQGKKQYQEKLFTNFQLSDTQVDVPKRFFLKSKMAQAKQSTNITAMEN